MGCYVADRSLLCLSNTKVHLGTDMQQSDKHELPDMQQSTDMKSPVSVDISHNICSYTQSDHCNMHAVG